MNIQDILGKNYIEKFRFFESQTLFPPSWENLKNNRCPLCGNRLKVLRSGKTAYCNGKKHGKTYLIGMTKLSRIQGNLSTVAS